MKNTFAAAFMSSFGLTPAEREQRCTNLCSLRIMKLQAMMRSRMTES
ncbi:MAG: hypothetical protein ACLR13_06965 [Acutalibacteraceae bacterium]